MIVLGLAIFLISATAIGYEILLMRLLGIIQWHHFVSMIISIALLGYGASGSFVFLFKHWLLSRFEFAFALNAVAFGLSMVTSFVVAQTVPFNPLEILWDYQQFLYLLVIYLVLFVPFFCASNCICITFTKFRDQAHRIYRFDLLGAGAGALFVVLLLFALPPHTCIKVLGSMGFLAAGISFLMRKERRATILMLMLFTCGALMTLTWPQRWLSLRISEYKGLSMALNVPDTEILSQHFSPLGSLAVVRSPTIPFRHAPGQSLNCLVEPPPQLGIFTDGNALNPITRFDGDRASLAHLDCLSSALPYHLLKNPRVLILGAGGGSDVLMAFYQQARKIDAVEINHQIVDLVRRTYADFSGHLYEKDHIKIHLAEARGYVAGSRKRYDLIQVSLLDSFSASVSGAGAASASYLYTVEAVKTYLEHLQPEGLLAITRWLKVPPRDALKLFGTAVLALEALGTEVPGNHLAMIRSWNTTTLLIKRGVFKTADISSIKTFCRKRSFDVITYPGMNRDEANRFNILDEPYFYRGARALLGDERDGFLRRYKFTITPATDDRPYFFHFFKWRSFREILSLKGRGGLPLLEWGYPVLVATLLKTIMISFLFIFLPLLILKRQAGTWKSPWRLALYFFCLGLAFLFVEIAFIQKFILFLHHPIYAVSIVLGTFLVFAGIGSGFTLRWSQIIEKTFSKVAGMPIAAAVILIALLSITYLILLPVLFEHAMPLPKQWKIPASILLIAPLAFFMGMPFPLGLSRVARSNPDFIPWAWGINGCASVLSAILATILSIHFGFNMVILFALALYVFSALALWKPLF